MKWTSPHLPPLLLALILLLAGCHDQSPVTSEPDIPSSRAAFSVEARTPSTMDEEFIRIAELVPGFGGFYQDRETRRFHVYMTDLTNAPAAQEAVTRFVRRGGESNPQFVFLQGEYDFRALAQWRERIDEVGWTQSLITLTAIDDLTNRVLVGVKDDAGVDQLGSILADMGIPAEALDIRVIAPDIEDLQSLHDTILGGIQIQAPGTCTLTGVAVQESPFEVYHPDGPRYLMTASHCTETFGTVTGATMGQPTLARPVGQEFVDPPLRGSASAPGCPTSDPRCRFSDAVLFTVNPGIHTAFDSIAHSLWGTPTFTSPYHWPLAGRQKSTWTGQYVEKIGRTTGRTGGFVTNTCVTSHVAASATPPVPRYLLCQVHADYERGGGDSGAPVYYISSPWKRMLGIHRGYNPTLDVATFSALWHAESEISNQIFQQTGDSWWPALSAGPVTGNP